MVGQFAHSAAAAGAGAIGGEGGLAFNRLAQLGFNLMAGALLGEQLLGAIDHLHQKILHATAVLVGARGLDEGIDALSQLLVLLILLLIAALISAFPA